MLRCAPGARTSSDYERGWQVWTSMTGLEAALLIGVAAGLAAWAMCGKVAVLGCAERDQRRLSAVSGV